MFIPSRLGRNRVSRSRISGECRVSEASRDQVRSELKTRPLQAIYYDKSFVRSLFKNTPFRALAAKRPLP